MSRSEELPSEAVDEFEILFTGYVPEDFPTGWGTTAAVAPTVAFVRDGDRRIVYDPGTVPSPSSILEPLKKLGYEVGDITDVTISHHHPDHTVNIALFPNAAIQISGALTEVTSGPSGTLGTASTSRPASVSCTRRATPSPTSRLSWRPSRAS